VPDSDSLVRTDDVVALLGAPDTVIVDVRSPREYLGVETTAARDGHVPGALNIEWSNNLGEIQEGIYVLRSDQELRELYETASVTPDKRAVVYCHSGSRTSFTYMVLKHLGYERVVALVPGWQEWGNRPDTPVQTE
jgi:thiosulfate/3-mercaptopyruvate sulfurtransferase